MSDRIEQLLDELGTPLSKRAELRERLERERCDTAGDPLNGSVTDV